MSRSQRLLQLLQILRRHRRPVQGQVLAQELGISVRTLYRDMATLKAQGADIEGEPGLGYVLRPGFTLPPLMLTQQEIAALVLGTRWIAARADSGLADAAYDALAKIVAVLPADLRTGLEVSPLLIAPAHKLTENIDLATLRQSMYDEVKLHIHYQDAKDRTSERLIWPVALSYFEQVCILIAWCELRQAFRHFRSDRITHATPTTGHYPKRRLALLEEWKKVEGIESSDTSCTFHFK